MALSFPLMKRNKNLGCTEFAKNQIFGLEIKDPDSYRDANAQTAFISCNPTN